MASKVLVADDSLKIQRQLTEMLQAAGVEVVSVSNGEHALRKLPDVRPDVVLADVFMPVRSGYEVCEFIRNNENLAHIPVLLLASTLEPYDEKEAARVRADGKLEKPFAKPEDTLAAIQECLEKAAQRPAQPAPPEPAAVEPPSGAPEPLEEPEPEPEPEEEAPARPAVQFEPTEAPMSFTDILEEGATAGGGSQEKEEATPVVEAPLAPEAIEPEPITPEPAEEAVPANAVEETMVQKPDMAAPWEMTGPEPGAPEIPAGEGWDSQWKVEDESAAEEPVEAADVSAPAAEEPVTAEEPSQAEVVPSDPAFSEELDGDIGTVIAKSAREVVSQTTKGGGEVDPAVVERVVKQVLEQLSPKLTETIARELVRPLAESLLKEKLKD